MSGSDLWLVFGGKSGWIGQQMVALLQTDGLRVASADSRLDDAASMHAELDLLKPAFVLNCAGLTGRPNVDWCEDHKLEVIRVNVTGTQALIDACFTRNIHITNFATGCIFEYDAAHPIGSGIGFTEDDKPNFFASFYSLTKGMVEQTSRFYPNMLLLRVRMPLSDDLNPRNFITKISKYEKVVNVPNSMTILTDCLPAALSMAKRKLTGVYNFTNPGVISHNQILDLYKQYIDPSFTYVNFTLEQQAEILKAGRSNNELDSTKFSAACPEVPHIQQGIIGLFERMAVNLGVSGKK